MKNFDDFWIYYLKKHAHPKNRLFHFYGTGIVHVIFFYVFVTGHIKYLWLGPFFGYSFAWLGHFLIEKNTPTTFGHPIWSAVADIRMFYLMLLKKM
jgi:hypothetical protein